MVFHLPINPLLVALATGTACAVLSVFVVLRRWAFIGEGISHAGFGGVGTALLISLAIPAMGDSAPVYAVAVTFCLLTALGVGWISRGRGVSGDAAIGIFVAATLAWGFVAFAIHDQQRHSGTSGWELYLLGELRSVSTLRMLSGVGVSAVVLMVVIALGRQIALYCFDPTLAEVTGVPTAFIHYLLIFLLAVLIIVAMGLAGNLLAPALLVLPGATGLAVSRRMKTVMTVGIVTSWIAVIAGLIVNVRWPVIPAGPAIVLAMFVEFAVAHLARRRVTADF